MVKTGMMIVGLVVACMAVVAPYAEAITCGEVAGNLLPCLNYLRSGGAVPTACCSGVNALNNMAKTTPVRQGICSCLKNMYTSNAGIKVPLAAGLPGKCGISIPYKISPSTDCSKIQ